MTIEDDIAFLSQVPVLRRLGAPALRILAIGAEAYSVEAGQVLFAAGDAADCAYVVQQGSFQLTPERASDADLVAGPGACSAKAPCWCNRSGPPRRSRARMPSCCASRAPCFCGCWTAIRRRRCACASLSRRAPTNGRARWRTSAPRSPAIPGRALSFSILALPAVLDFQAHQPRQQGRRIELSDHAFQIGETARQGMERHDVAVAQ